MGKLISRYWFLTAARLLLCPRACWSALLHLFTVHLPVTPPTPRPISPQLYRLSFVLPHIIQQLIHHQHHHHHRFFFIFFPLPGSGWLTFSALFFFKAEVEPDSKNKPLNDPALCHYWFTVLRVCVWGWTVFIRIYSTYFHQYWTLILEHPFSIVQLWYDEYDAAESLSYYVIDQCCMCLTDCFSFLCSERFSQ